MELSILVAKLYSVMAVVLGLGILSNPKYYRKAFLELLESRAALFYSGVVALVIGVFLVTYHNIWVKSWVVIITVIGWAALVKGVSLILFPERFKFLKKYYKDLKYWNFQAVALVLLGMVLGYFAFVI